MSFLKGVGVEGFFLIFFVIVILRVIKRFLVEVVLFERVLIFRFLIESEGLRESEK